MRYVANYLYVSVDNLIKDIMMKSYRNLNGNSNVVSYVISEDSIHVVFKSGKQRNYLYNNSRPGRSVVDQMKRLAEQGYGLNSYISTTVKTKFFRKW